MLVAKAKKVGEYWKAVMQVQDGEYRQNYYSFDRFVTRQTALRQARWWKYESDQVGYITPA